MKFQKTTALQKILKLKKRLRVIQGGTAAGKTISILLLFIDKAQSTEGNLASIVSETLPHLKRGAIRDFLSIMEAQGYYNDKLWNRTELTYTFETGSKLEFFSADQPDKVRGPRRNDLFLNECNNLSYDTYTQLAIRTDGDIYLDYNPTSSFWVHDRIIPNQEHDFLILTYKDNEALAPSVVKEIESRRGNKYFWKVYGEGQIGEVEGKIYRDWMMLEEMPIEARLERYGLDFGYSDDPTALIGVYYWNGAYIFDEILYQKGLSNKQIADTFANIERALVVADSAEPKSIDELKSYGINVVPTKKGADSVRHGIKLVQDQKIFYTKRSVNLQKEYRNYLWATDKNGVIQLHPQELWDHCLDAARYAISSLVPVQKRMEYINSLPMPHSLQKEAGNPAV